MSIASPEELARYEELRHAVLAATGFCEPSSFAEFCQALGAECPEKGDTSAWRQVWCIVGGLADDGYLTVKKNGRLTESLQLTVAGRDYIRARLDNSRGLLGLTT